MSMDVSAKEAVILQQLVGAGGGELYGLAMVKASNGALKLGTVYVTLGRLEDKGFVSSRKEEDPSQPVPRRLYKITGNGRRVFDGWRAAMDAYANAMSVNGVAHG